MRPQNTRVYPRFAMETPVVFRKGDRARHGWITNLSLGGVFIETLEPFDPEDLLVVQFTLPISSRTLEMKGLVRWREPVETKDRPAGMGLQFLEVLPDQDLLLKTFLASLQITPPGN